MWAGIRDGISWIIPRNRRIIAAIETSDLTAITRLFDGPWLFSADPFSRTSPLICASRLDRVALVAVLLEKQRCGGIVEAVRVAASSDRNEVLTRLIRPENFHGSNGYDARITALGRGLIAGAERGQVASCRTLLSAQAAVDFRESRRNFTGLMCGCFSGNLEIVELFVESGANVNLLTVNDWSPAAIATMRGHLRILELLLASGADKYWKGHLGLGLEQVAGAWGGESIVRKLLERS